MKCQKVGLHPSRITLDFNGYVAQEVLGPVQSSHGGHGIIAELRRRSLKGAVLVGGIRVKNRSQEVFVHSVQSAAVSMTLRANDTFGFQTDKSLLKTRM